jgi:hypothetical protein
VRAAMFSISEKMEKPFSVSSKKKILRLPQRLKLDSIILPSRIIVEKTLPYDSQIYSQKLLKGTSEVLITMPLRRFIFLTQKAMVSSSTMISLGKTGYGKMGNQSWEVPISII